ncbi:MAG: FAD-dependent oxidoreductase [Lentisphaerae bacterium]|nr:FAD-dependent oxidoreductase [Lentisphaerota bacterium]
MECVMYKDNVNHPDFNEELHCDFAVVGGGVAGVTAAIAAAREGVKTVLVQNRPVLGGVSSVEYGEGNGSFVNGAYNYTHRNARECGIIEELKNSNAWHFANGYHACWSQVLREAVEKEANITLLMNTEALSVDMDGDRIRSFTARMLNSEINYTIYADNFLDASGDGFFAAAGADYRMGREGKEEFNESLAPDQPDSKTMGSSIAFKAVDAGHPVSFKAPAGAFRFESDDDLPFRDHSDLNYGYWWMEYGGELDTIRDNEKIYTTLRNILYGIWDHVKNGGDHHAENHVITWISPICGKRESRRMLGDIILNQNDIMDDREFPDTVAYGGWPIDIHPPEGIFYHGHPGSLPPFFFPPLYGIPFRCLYSRNVSNLMMAGRNISVSHVALGTTRVMATCAVCAQAVGTAAALLKKYHCSPREIYAKHLDELLILLQKNDHAIPRRPVRIPDDLVHTAHLSADSSLTLKMMKADGSELLTWEPKSGLDPCDTAPDDRRKGQYFILSGRELESVGLLMDNASGQPQTLTARMRKDENGSDLAVAVADILPGQGHIVRFKFNLSDLEPGQYIFILDPVEKVSFATSTIHLPGIFRKADGCYHNFNNMVFNITPSQRLYDAENLHNDCGRPAAGKPNIWIAEAGFPRTVTLQWDEAVSFDRIDLTFDTNLDRYRTMKIPPECIRDFKVEYEQDGMMVPLLEEKDNFSRFRRFDLKKSITTGKVQITLLASQGDEFARLYGVRICQRNSKNS